jgi:deoxyhypusine synthase
VTIDDEIRRAEEAQRIYNNPLLKEAFEKIEQAMLERMKKVGLGEKQHHTDLVMMVQVVQGVRNHFKEIMETGQMAQIQKETLAQQVKRRLGR